MSDDKLLAVVICVATIMATSITLGWIWGIVTYGAIVAFAAVGPWLLTRMPAWRWIGRITPW